MALIVVIMLVVCIAMPLAFSWRVWRLHQPSRTAWMLAVADAAVFVALVLLVGRWDMAGYHTRFLLLGLFLVSVAASWRRHAARPWQAPAAPPLWRSRWSTLVSLLLFAAVLAYVLAGLLPAGPTLQLAFPLRDGRFVIAQGGGNALLNHHATHRRQRRAADITAVNGAGFRAAGLLPADLGRYVVYGASVVAPCAGPVLRAQDGLPDLVPPEADPDHPAGNHVVLSCDGIEVELAHLRDGSVRVQPGERVDAGDPVGRVGNSGNTTEPHLHIHAVDPRTGAGVQMSFDGLVPVRNRTYRR